LTPAETWSNSDVPEIQTREIAVLQQRARALEAEVKLRRELEAALRDALASLRRSEDELRRSKQELQDFVDNAAEGLTRIGPDGIILWANQAELDLVGCTHDEYVGHHITEFRCEREAVEDIFARLARDETVRNREVRIRCKDGSIRHVLVNSNVLWENGKFVHTRCLTRDITARKKAHEALAFLADASALLSSSLDHESTLASLANLAVPRIADGCAVELACDPTLPKGSVLVGHFEPGASLAPAIASVLRTGKPVMQGTVLVVPMTARGRVLGAIALGATQPDRRFEPSDLEMAEELGRRAALAVDNARLYQEAREADRRKDEFLAMLGHELRNPLAPILTALQLMKLRGSAGEREHKMIERQVRHLNRLIDDLLDVSRITRGKVQLQREPVELAGVLAKAIEMASPLFEARSHSLSIDVPREPLLVDGDQVRLAQVFANLLVNAAKYTEPGGQMIVSARREKGQVSVSVKDNGIGIAAEVLPKVFDLFVQAERGIDRSQGGLGIGLALARSLVDLHGGTIAARSEGPGRGSEFIVRLPLSVTRSVPAKASTAEASAPAPRRSGLRILLVDDNLDAVDLLAEGLRSFGHEVAVAHDGPAALTVARDFRPNTALLDIGLPVMDGYELATVLRKAQGSDPLRLIALTGYGQDADKARSQDAGFDVHLVKPVDLDTVAALLDAKTG
jgi:PAS domain S-box-containing protein